MFSEETVKYKKTTGNSICHTSYIIHGDSFIQGLLVGLRLIYYNSQCICFVNLVIHLN
jgi:hypothetical protein